MESGLKSWQSIQGCSVEVEESSEEPSALSETIIMTQASVPVVATVISCTHASHSV